MDIDAMIKDYEGGMGTSAIAKKYGLKSAGSAQYYLQKAGVFVPKIQRDERTVEELHKQGWAADRIAAEVGMKREKVLEMTKWKGEPKPPPQGGQFPQFLKGVEPVKIHGTNHKTTEDLDRLMKEVAGSLTDEQIASFKKKPNGKQSNQDVHDKNGTTNNKVRERKKETVRIGIPTEEVEYEIVEKVAWHGTGKDTKGKPRLGLVPPGIIEAVGIIRTYGTEKYGSPDNWKKVPKEDYVDAMMRHLVRYLKEPQSKDDESGYPHLWHMACNIAFLIEMEADVNETKRSGGFVE